MLGRAFPGDPGVNALRVASAFSRRRAPAVFTLACRDSHEGETAPSHHLLKYAAVGNWPLWHSRRPRAFKENRSRLTLSLQTF